jgi:hypothetical protein
MFQEVYSLTFYHGALVSVSVSYLRFTSWHRDKDFSKYFGLGLSISFHQCFILTFLCMLLLPEKQAGNPRNISKSTAPSEIGKNWMKKYYQFFYTSLFSDRFLNILR